MQYDIDEEKELKKAAFRSFLRWAVIAEAKASVALDKDPDCHTCNMECTEFPQCPGNKNAAE